jgi:hypothetical protein
MSELELLVEIEEEINRDPGGDMPEGMAIDEMIVGITDNLIGIENPNAIGDEEKNTGNHQRLEIRSRVSLPVHHEFNDKCPHDLAAKQGCSDRPELNQGQNRENKNKRRHEGHFLRRPFEIPGKICGEKIRRDEIHRTIIEDFSKEARSRVIKTRHERKKDSEVTEEL